MKFLLQSKLSTLGEMFDMCLGQKMSSPMAGVSAGTQVSEEGAAAKHSREKVKLLVLGGGGEGERQR